MATPNLSDTFDQAELASGIDSPTAIRLYNEIINAGMTAPHRAVLVTLVLRVVDPLTALFDCVVTL
jgi:hypothetical protein